MSTDEPADEFERALSDGVAAMMRDHVARMFDTGRAYLFVWDCRVCWNIGRVLTTEGTPFPCPRCDGRLIRSATES